MAVCTAGQLEGLAHAYLAAVLQGCRKGVDAEVRQHLEETLTDDVTYSVGFTAPPRKGLDVFLTNLGKDNKVFSGWSMTPLSTAVCSDSCLAFMLVDESFEMSQSGEDGEPPRRQRMQSFTLHRVRVDPQRGRIADIVVRYQPFEVMKQADPPPSPAALPPSGALLAGLNTSRRAHAATASIESFGQIAKGFKWRPAFQRLLSRQQAGGPAATTDEPAGPAAVVHDFEQHAKEAIHAWIAIADSSMKGLRAMFHCLAEDVCVWDARGLRKLLGTARSRDALSEMAAELHMHYDLRLRLRDVALDRRAALAFARWQADVTRKDSGRRFQLDCMDVYAFDHLGHLTDVVMYRTPLDGELPQAGSQPKAAAPAGAAAAAGLGQPTADKLAAEQLAQAKAEAAAAERLQG